MRTQGFCPGCGKIFDIEQGIFFCSACLMQTRPWNAFAFYGLYEGFLRDLILAFKFANCLSLRAVLAHHLFYAYRYHLEASSPDLIVPVPLHHKRLAERGFNQSLELAKLLGGKLDCKVSGHALIRIRYTPPQSNLRRRQRLQNIRGAICADKNMVRGQRILLVDDIYTTGTTLEVCADALLEAGCSCVEVIVLARAF